MDARARGEWERPGAFEVAAGVYRIPLPLPGDALRAVNVYAVRDVHGLVLVDAGWALEQSLRTLEQALAELEADLGSVSRFLVTHLHRDHYTQAVTVRRLFGARVSLGIGEKNSLTELRRDADRLPPRLLARLSAAGGEGLVHELRSVDGSTDPVDPWDWSGPDDWLEDGQRIEVGGRSLEAVATPGHTSGHLVFHDAANNLLFTGDHVLPHITPSIGFETVPAAAPLADYLRSLCRVAELDDAVMLPAHGPAGGSTRARIVALLEHHDTRLMQMTEAVGRGASTGLEVAEAVPWTRHELRFAELGVFNQMLALNETSAHLDVLTSRGIVIADLSGPVHGYRVS
jgi:glyoxylase-like metal-dependent hydrolase (beta-lactamase superfamily II)